MADNPTNSFKPTAVSKETILGMTRSLEQRFGCIPRHDLATTLNTKFDVFANRKPVNDPKIHYYCMGVKGRVNDDMGLSSAQHVLGTNMALYGMLPFRAVTLEEDLSSDDRDQYAMRVVKKINNIWYVSYYLKRIDFSKSQVQYIRTDPASGASTIYDIDPNNLSPTPPKAGDNGIITDISDQISVVLPGSMRTTGDEVIEAVNVLYGGDQRYSWVSEIGFVSASPEIVTAKDANDNPFPYTEAIMAQLVDQYNWVGQPFFTSADVWARTMSFTLLNLINQA